ncbi:MAG: AraC family transcriptional regulator [Tangfeifania sp.]
MKPIYFKQYSPPPDYSFLVRYAEVPHTYNRFHYHKEFEILYNIENNGTRFVGDSIRRFSNGDLVLVGPHIPHYWHSDDRYFEGIEDLSAKVVLVQFDESFLGKKFTELPEVKNIKSLFSKAAHGIRFRGRDATKIGEKIIQISEEQSWKRLLLMIEMLCMMSEANDYELLSSKGFTEASKYANQEKMSDLFNFMIANFDRDLNLEEAANRANMNVSAFCRYFKKSTSKTFSHALNEIRIGFACKKMISSDRSISEIAFECGFNNISYFNRVFKNIKQVTPQKYREMHVERIIV